MGRATAVAEVITTSGLGRAVAARGPRETEALLGIKVVMVVVVVVVGVGVTVCRFHYGYTPYRGKE